MNRPTKELPLRLRPESCYVCGKAQHPDRPGDHNYWSNADADDWFKAEEEGTRYYSPEAAYVAQHRPY